MNQPIDIDQIMAKTWLLVTQLRYGHYNETEPLYSYCCQQIESVRTTLMDAKLASEDIEHITYAQCALLDNTVMTLLADNETLNIWKEAPLQVRYFSSLDAGEVLWDRINRVLNQINPQNIVLICFHRVIRLGFLPDNLPSSIQKPEHYLILEKLSNQIIDCDPPSSLVIKNKKKYQIQWLHSFLFWFSLLLILIIAMTWGGQTWLNHLLFEVDQRIEV